MAVKLKPESIADIVYLMFYYQVKDPHSYENPHTVSKNGVSRILGLHHTRLIRPRLGKGMTGKTWGHSELATYLGFPTEARINEVEQFGFTYNELWDLIQFFSIYGSDTYKLLEGITREQFTHSIVMPMTSPMYEGKTLKAMRRIIVWHDLLPYTMLNPKVAYQRFEICHKKTSLNLYLPGNFAHE